MGKVRLEAMMWVSLSSSVINFSIIHTEASEELQGTLIISPMCVCRVLVLLLESFLHTSWLEQVQI